MRVFLKTLLAMSVLYVLFWLGLAVYFSFADRHRDLLEANLSSMFGRTVTIEKLTTSWHGLKPQFQAQNLVVVGDSSDQAAFSLKSVSARLQPLSLLRFWPQFEEFAVDSPQLEVVTFNDGRVRIAGFELQGTGAGKPKRIIDWLLAQQSGVWHNGTLIWQREGKSAQRFENISFVYDRQQQQRTIQAAIETTKGTIAFKSRAQGNPFSERNWDAAFEVLGSGGRRLLTADDLSAKVVDGVGELTLKMLHVQRVQDFLQFAGLTSDQHWLLAAKVDGRLHDLRFKFSGPLLEIDDWSLQASASNISFASVGQSPSMDNLSGKLNLSNHSGEFSFATENSVFRWPQRFYHDLPIAKAKGELTWQREAPGVWQLSIQDTQYSDPSIQLKNLNAELKLNRPTRRIESFGDLFKVENVIDLSFEEGSIVDATANRPPHLRASANFNITDVTRLSHYLPKIDNLELFRKWAAIAFKSGTASNGELSYEGELSAQAFNKGRAKFTLAADYADAEVDYAPKLRWPAVEKSSGSARIENQLLTITPDEAWMNGDRVAKSELKIERLFQIDRLLKVQGQMTTSLKKGLEFVFKGPLIKPENQLEAVPFDVESGWVDMDVSVELPLNKLNEVQVRGSSVIRDGKGLLPSTMPMEDIQAQIRFTETTMESDSITARFLGGKTRAKLETVTPAQPPIMRLTAQGEAHVNELEPWVGEHILSLMSGQTKWQGAMLIEGNSLEVSGTSDLAGVVIDAPSPVGKAADQSTRFGLGMALGSAPGDFKIQLNYQDELIAHFEAEVPGSRGRTQRGSQSGQVPSLFDRSVIMLKPIGVDATAIKPEPGVNFDLQYPALDVDEWLSTIIDLASFVPREPVDNTVFLDAMRSIKMVTPSATFLGRPYGLMDINALSVDGKTWIGTVAGEHMNGTMHLEPRKDTGHYSLNLDRFNVPKLAGQRPPVEAVDYSLRPENYPYLNLSINRFSSQNKSLGQLTLIGAPHNGVLQSGALQSGTLQGGAKPNAAPSWKIDTLELSHNGVLTNASGAWTNDPQSGSISQFQFSTQIDEAGGALDEMDFKGILRKGQGSVTGMLSWIGAPHEFDVARLNGDFNAFVKDGELVQVEPGGGKLLGLFNMNAILRRLVFDFSDVVASGLRFDRMRITGVLADGEAVLQDAFVLSPAVFVTMEGKVDIDKEMIDMEVHVSPELGGNLALLSALANPAAGAVVFLTQQLFKDDLRKSNFRSFRALGSWEEFELEEIRASNSTNDSATPQADAISKPLSTDPTGE